MTGSMLSPPKRQVSTAMGLALRDFLHEWQISMCLVLALTAVLTPLLVLFGLKTGIVTTMTERLTSDPRNLEIKIIGNGRFGDDWFDALGTRDDVLFLVPRTRSLAATLELVGLDGRAVGGVELVASGDGDPLLASDQGAPKGDGIYLSHTAAGKLELGMGDFLTGLVTRTVNGEREAGRRQLKILGILPETAFGRDGVFVGLDLLTAVEDYRDGYAVAAFDWPGTDREGKVRLFAGARLYARSLDDVAILADHLRAQGLEVRTRAKEIETVRAIDRVLSDLFYIIAGIGITGYALSLAVSLWANVDRKRKDLSLMRLMGYSKGGVVLFPLTQSVIVAAFGAALSVGLYALVENYLNASMAQNLARDEFVSTLSPEIYIITVGLTLGLALAASAIGGMRAVGIDPAESLRDV